MSLSEDTSIYRTAYRLLILSQPIVSQMPRTYRFDLGQRITNTLLDVLTLIIEANRAQDKQQPLYQLKVKHEVLQMLIMWEWMCKPSHASILPPCCLSSTAWVSRLRDGASL